MLRDARPRRDISMLGGGGLEKGERERVTSMSCNEARGSPDCKKPQKLVGVNPIF